MTIALHEEGIGARATRELARMAAVFTVGEAEIAQAYFDGEKRSQETDILFLTSQAGRMNVVMAPQHLAGRAAHHQ